MPSQCPADNTNPIAHYGRKKEGKGEVWPCSQIRQIWQGQRKVRSHEEGRRSQPYPSPSRTTTPAAEEAEEVRGIGSAAGPRFVSSQAVLSQSDVLSQRRGALRDKRHHPPRKAAKQPGSGWEILPRRKAYRVSGERNGALHLQVTACTAVGFDSHAFRFGEVDLTSLSRCQQDAP
jgi:hypothetical protein